MITCFASSLTIIFRCTKLCKVGHCLMLFGIMFEILTNTEQPKPVALYCTTQSWRSSTISSLVNFLPFTKLRASTDRCDFLGFSDICDFTGIFSANYSIKKSPTASLIHITFLHTWLTWRMPVELTWCFLNVGLFAAIKSLSIYGIQSLYTKSSCQLQT